MMCPALTGVTCSDKPGHMFEDFEGFATGLGVKFGSVMIHKQIIFEDFPLIPGTRISWLITGKLFIRKPPQARLQVISIILYFMKVIKL